MRRRLVAVALATTLTVTIAFVVPLALAVRVLAAERALDEADRVARALLPVLVTGDQADTELAVEQLAATTAAQVSVHLEDGTVVGPAVGDSSDVERARAGVAIDRRQPDASRTLLTPVVRQGGTRVIEVRVPAASLSAGVRQAWLTLVAVGVGLVAIAVLIADRLGRTAVVQATGVAAAARRLASGDRDARAPQGGTPELDDAALALNTLADRIDALLAAEREAAADLSHRLRTPMTALRLDVEALPASPATQRVVDDLAALDAEVDRMIRAARGAGSGDGSQLSDVGRVVQQRSEFWSALAADESREWSCACTPGEHVVALDEDRLAAAVDALLGNVLTHTDPPGGCRISVDRAGPHVRVRVDDDGPGVPPAAVARGRSGGGSTGLGLDIARRTAESVGGELRIGDRHPGGRVELLLPAVPAPAAGRETSSELPRQPRARDLRGFPSS